MVSNVGKLNAYHDLPFSAIEFGDTDHVADMIDSLFEDSHPVLFEGLNRDYVRNSMPPFAGDFILAQKVIQDFLNGKELNPDEEVALGAAMPAATSGKGFSQVQKTIQIVSLFHDMHSPFEELNADYAHNSTSPSGRDEMMIHAEMIKYLLECIGFLLVKENRNNVQKMMQLFEELNTDCSCDSKVERYDSGSGELNAHDDVLAKNHRAKRLMMMAKLEEVTTDNGSDKCSAHTDAVQKTTQELVNRSGRFWSSCASCHVQLAKKRRVKPMTMAFLGAYSVISREGG